MRILFLALAVTLLGSGLAILVFWAAAVVDSVVHHHSIGGKDPFFIVFLPVLGAMTLKWARDSWKRSHAWPSA